MLIVSDLDGTLLNGKQEVSRENKQAIERFVQNGGRFTIATGRMERSVQPFIDSLSIDIPVILYNGAKVYCPKSKKVIVEKSLTGYKQFAKELMESRLNNDLGFLLYHAGEVYTHNRNEIIRKHEVKDGVICKSIADNILDFPVTKILLISPSEEVLTQCEEKVLESNLPCEMVYSEKNYLEILPMNASKGTALQELIQYCQWDDIQTIAVGDNLNDVSMLETATIGYLVENCHDSLREAKFEKTVHHEKHAIAEIIHKNFFQKNESVIQKGGFNL